MQIRFIQHAAAVVACLGLVLPQNALAAPTAPQAAGKDVALRDGGVLVGQVVDAQGAPLAHAVVSLFYGADEVVRTKTDKRGVFAAKGLRGGEYRVVAGGGQVTYRLWAAKTAPPAASQGVLIVTGGAVISGQCSSCPPGGGCQPGYGYPPGHGGGGGIVGWIKNHPLIVASGVAAAIAIPLAVADDDDAS
ncbi:MAG: carboxypeptidase-like regulatory domain-containing protein [Planctomycetota bacterium]